MVVIHARWRHHSSRSPSFAFASLNFILKTVNPCWAAGSRFVQRPHEDCDHGYLLEEAVRDRSTILMGGGSASSIHRTGGSA
jgi:hypothetical protein